MDKERKIPGRVLTFRAPPELVAALDKKSRRERVTQSQAIREALAEWVAA